MKNGETREGYEKIYDSLKDLLSDAHKLAGNYRPKDGLDNFQLHLLCDAVENAVEVYGEMLGFVTYDD